MSTFLRQVQITLSAEEAFKDAQALLKQGYISKVEAERRHQSWLSQKSQLQYKTQEIVSAKAKLAQIDIRLAQLPNESAQRIARLKSQLSDLDGRLAELESRHAYTITAPVDGIIASITTRTVGQSVQSGQPLLSILPNGSTLEAELFVPSRAAGFVVEGQEVKLLYDAFPYQRFGSYGATVTKITTSILSPRELSAPVELQEPVYRVTAAINADVVETGQGAIALQPGMTLQANIILERRSFLEWLLEPLYAVRART